VIDLPREIKFGVRISRVACLPTPPKNIVDGYDTAFINPATGKPMEADPLLTPYERLEWSVVKECVHEAEKLGFDSVILADHPMIGRARLDCMAALGALAGVTTKINLGTMTTNTMRYLPSPALFAKQIASLDFITGGRIYPLGLGAGYLKEEYDAYGFPFGTHLARIEQLKETVEIMKRMFVEEKANYKGKYFEIKNAICEPKPIQQPFPICIGGGGKHLLRVAARYADFVNIDPNETYDASFSRSDYVKETERYLSHLESEVRAAGRDWEAEIVKSRAFWFWLYENEKERNKHAEAIKNQRPGSVLMGTPEEIIELFQKLVDLGITYFTLRFEDLPDTKGLHLFAENVMPAFQ
jgi:alkanesulfonate monooxygenase SsuD/methylene tetrahydromethanopterin reductase-like flavin-dependent oxidoreductase (luciferase family)